MLVIDKIVNEVKKELKLSKQEFNEVKRAAIDYSMETGLVITKQFVEALHFALKRA